MESLYKYNMSKLEDKLKKFDIKFNAEHIGLVPDPFDLYIKTKPKNERLIDHWKCIIEYNSKKFDTDFYTGLGCRKLVKFVKRERNSNGSYKYVFGPPPHSYAYNDNDAARRGFIKPQKPSLADVINSYLVDASSANETHSEWCSNFGYSTDSRNGLEVYLKCQEHKEKFLHVFGYKLFEELSALEH